ncbi:ATP-binding protein, partial [Altibacter sp.]|uniref:sensor histidine kinase n=1 Tax=Altibacter sp. TaxID=2024823 RepID=UPI003312F9D4
KNSAIIIPSLTGVTPSEGDTEILKRFSNVFEQAYIRFMDLQKAEAQARETHIEMALERVRSRTMAMQQSNEIGDVAQVLFEQLTGLGGALWGTGFAFCEENASEDEFWFVNKGGILPHLIIPNTVDPVHKEMYKGWKDQLAIFSTAKEGKELVTHYKYMLSVPDVQPIFQKMLDDGITFPTWQKWHAAYFKHGYLLVITTKPYEDEEIFIRFAKVFEQTYTRFLDLQKAEEQAREAKIEASLEKVRSVALSLQKSDDMLDIAKILYEQLLELGFSKIRNAIIDIHNESEETFLDYDYSHDMSSAITKFSFYGDPVIEQQIKKVKSSNDAFFEIELKGKQLDELIETRLRNGEKDDPRLRDTDHLTYNLYSFGNGAIGISNFGILSDEQKEILKRFRNVFTFAYKRYTDLAHAEAQAREAKIEAALEKVRSVALSMDESTDLLHIAKALYEQLEALGFSDIRNAIIDVNNEDDHTFLDYDYSHEMGSTVTLMSYDDDPTLEEQLRVIADTTDGYSETILEGQQLEDLINMRRKNGEADDPRLFKAEKVSYILYAFGNGAIGISNFGILSKDQKNILDRFRNVFTFAYQRFTDLQVKEKQSAALLAEKQRLELTLSDLQATQKQLIHSEKMASLGELTAGIAHEIQNPLNFVNNFSEVSQELIEELKEELKNGNMEDVTELLVDIVQNLEKINHHGKRADGIVKGMLQHSRSSSAVKEPTNINKLADEYLRLAYHGLRAKDKSFNATLETNFDERIGMVPVIPQDIGRVILNLITNAFYAVNERKNASEGTDYEATVSVCTKLVKDKVEISVRDNGFGIPKDVLDKIFQPFFTTKPTGQGTGLGLSMSYDIVTKAHQGELKVETEEGNGTEFKIILSKK